MKTYKAVFLITTTGNYNSKSSNKEKDIRANSKLEAYEISKQLVKKVSGVEGEYKTEVVLIMLEELED